MRKEISAPVSQLISAFQDADSSAAIADVPTIKVNTVISKIAFLYEKVRTVVDMKEEHLLRKDAIRRGLTRRMVVGATGESISLPLIQELIRGGYLENETVPQDILPKVSEVIDRYAALISGLVQEEKGSERKKLHKWFIEIAACEVDETIVPRVKDYALVDTMYRVVHSRFVAKEEKMSVAEKDIQVYIAVLKVLLKADNSLIEYNLLKLYYPQWQTLDVSNIRKIRQKLFAVKSAITSHIEHPLRQYFFGKIRRHAPYFIVLQDILEDNQDSVREIMQSPEEFENAIESATNRRYAEQKEKTKRSIFRVLIYVFLTKMLLALALEAPLDWYFFREIHYIPLAINIVFHPLFLALLVWTAGSPDSKNTEKIITHLKEIVYGEENEENIEEIKRTPKKSVVSEAIFNSLYAVTFIVSFGITVFILLRLNFNIIGIVLFLFFFSVVSFFGIKVRHTSREMVVLERKDNLISFVLGLLALPIVRAGRWISLNFSRVNFVVFFLDVIVEAPFKTVLVILEEWFQFLKEKKDEVLRET